MSDNILSDDLLLRLDFRDPDPEVIDLSPVGGMVSTLQEGKIECLSGDKVRTFPPLYNHAFIRYRSTRMSISTISSYDTPGNPLFFFPRSMASGGLCPWSSC